ncbi:MAG TPA: hypothetical protein VFJ16_14285 [Longimicrobium sp.]|nr:hypothetical protein [Longimicrobium sp.]
MVHLRILSPVLLLMASPIVCGCAAAQQRSAPANQSTEHYSGLATQHEHSAWMRVAELIRARSGRSVQCFQDERCLDLVVQDTSITGDSLNTGDTLTSALRDGFTEAAEEFELSARMYDLAGVPQTAARARTAAGVLRMELGEDHAALENLGQAYFADPHEYRQARLSVIQERLKDQRVVILVLANPPGLPYRMRFATDGAGAFVDKTATGTVRSRPGAYIFVAQNPHTGASVVKRDVCSNDYDCTIDFRF